MPGWQASPTCRLQASSRRSGCIPAEPYPPLEQAHFTITHYPDNGLKALFLFCSHAYPFARSNCLLLLDTPVSFCSHHDNAVNMTRFIFDIDKVVAAATGIA